MIFKQIDEILSGSKTQTRRVCKPGETLDEPLFPPFPFVMANSRVKWSVGHTYAVQPGRGEPAVWWRTVNGKLEVFRGRAKGWQVLSTNDGYGQVIDERVHFDYSAAIRQLGFQPLRIRITNIRQENLQGISPEDAQAEGVRTIAEYKCLWHSINKAKGTRWEDNPLVWVLTFELVQGE